MKTIMQRTRTRPLFCRPPGLAVVNLPGKPFENFQASLLSKYVGKQYLDNTQNENVTLEEYFINDLRFSYQITPKGLDAIELSALINNFFDVDYSSNGYSYGGVPYFYPQAGD